MASSNAKNSRDNIYGDGYHPEPEDYPELGDHERNWSTYEAVNPSAINTMSPNTTDQSLSSLQLWDNQSYARGFYTDSSNSQAHLEARWELASPSRVLSTSEASARWDDRQYINGDNFGNMGRDVHFGAIQMWGILAPKNVVAGGDNSERGDAPKPPQAPPRPKSEESRGSLQMNRQG